MNKHHGLMHIPDTTRDESTLPAWYRASDVDARIAALEKALRAAHACCCRECANEIERLLPNTKIA